MSVPELLFDFIKYKLKGFKVPVVINLSPRMKKLSRALITGLLLICAISLWLIGSIIVIQIDSQELIKFRRLTDHEKGMRIRVDRYCQVLDKNNLRDEAQKSLTHEIHARVKGNVVSNESIEILERARREKLIRDNLIYFPEFQQMWCLVPKAASTSWSKAIVDRLNSDHLRMFVDPKSNISLQVLLRQNYGNVNKNIYTEAVKSPKIKKVLLVRHPFARLISAYQDKLLDRKARQDGMYFFHFFNYRRYGVSMNRQFRANRKVNKKKEPTFDEFVQYLINTNTMEYDEHWKPISLMCGLCNVRYDHIILVDDLRKTSEFHLQALGFPEGYKLPFENTKQIDKKFGETFQNISNSKKIQLLKKYQDDFRLFGYSFLKHYV